MKTVVKIKKALTLVACHVSIIIMVFAPSCSKDNDSDKDNEYFVSDGKISGTLANEEWLVYEDVRVFYEKSEFDSEPVVKSAITDEKFSFTLPTPSASGFVAVENYFKFPSSVTVTNKDAKLQAADIMVYYVFGNYEDGVDGVGRRTLDYGVKGKYDVYYYYVDKDFTAKGTAQVNGKPFEVNLALKGGGWNTVIITDVSLKSGAIPSDAVWGSWN